MREVHDIPTATEHDGVIDLGAATEKTFGFPDLEQYEEEVIPRLRDTP